MAYFSKEDKNKIAPMIKELCAKYKVKGSLSIYQNMKVVLTITKGELDFIGNVLETSGYHADNGYIDVNVYHFEKHFSDKVVDFLKEAKKILDTDNYNNSDPMSDYFDIGHYIGISVGKWNKPYELTVK